MESCGQRQTLQAARIAGMPGVIRLVTEPEAAALATLKDKAEENSLKVKRINLFFCNTRLANEGNFLDRRCVCCMRRRRRNCCMSSAPVYSLYLTTGFQDLISYEIEHLSPLKIKECAIGSGPCYYFLWFPPRS